MQLEDIDMRRMVDSSTASNTRITCLSWSA